jgi:hypothetical protein
MRTLPAALLPAALVLLPAGPARGQDGSLSELLPRLLSEAVTMPSTVGTVAGNPHEAHFLPAAAQLKAPYALNGALVTQLSTFPLGSSSGGFTYTTDPKTGIPERNSNNFGPSFAERALTNGKGRFSAGLNFQHVEFDEFEGLGLTGDVRFYLQHNDCCPLQRADGTPNPNAEVEPSPPEDKNPFFEGDLVRADLTLKAKTDTVVFFANYGITNRFDLGLAVPIVSVDLTASMDSTLIRLATSANPAIHSFGSTSPDTRRSSESGSSSGLGDVVVRGKYNFLARPGGGFALGVDLRLPTGDEKELRGTGATQAKVSLYYSGDYGKFAPHYNIGYTFSSGSIDQSFATYALGDEVPDPITGASGAYENVFRGETPASPLTAADLEVPDEINYTAGFVLAAHPRVSLSADFIGRTLLDVNRFALVDQSFNYRTTTGGPLQAQTYSDGVGITQSQGRLNLFLGVAGIKVNLTRTLLLTANVLFPLSDDGLRPKVTPVVGLDYAF